MKMKTLNSIASILTTVLLSGALVVDSASAQVTFDLTSSEVTYFATYEAVTEGQTPTGNITCEVWTTISFNSEVVETDYSSSTTSESCWTTASGTFESPQYYDGGKYCTNGTLDTVNIESTHYIQHEGHPGWFDWDYTDDSINLESFCP